MTKFKHARLLAILVAIGMFAAAAATAQVHTGSIAGTVRDKAGAVIPNATVAARNVENGAQRTVQSSAEGSFNIVALPPGDYEVTITSGSFTPFKQKTAVTVGGTITVDATLGVSGGATSVEVTAEAAGVEVNTQTQEQAQVITPEQVAQLPSLTRNPYDFIGLAGNVSGGDRSSQSGNPQTSGGGQNSTDRGVGYSINGQRATGTEILMDGVENTNLFDTSIALEIPQDAVQEFRVVTNNFDAQYGRASGGVINVSTKSGTNNLHGSAWEYNRLAAYTANTYDNNANGIPKGQYTRNQFGFTVGGPIVKNKLFFYQSTEWLRVRSDASLLTYVPTPQFIAAAAPNVQQYFQQNGNNTFPFISTVSKNQLAGKFGPGGSFDQALPGNTPIFGLVNYKVPADAGGDSPQNTYDLVARVDYNWTTRPRCFSATDARICCCSRVRFRTARIRSTTSGSRWWTTPIWVH